MTVWWKACTVLACRRAMFACQRSLDQVLTSCRVTRLFDQAQHRGLHRRRNGGLRVHVPGHPVLQAGLQPTGRVQDPRPPVPPRQLCPLIAPPVRVCVCVVDERLCCVPVPRCGCDHQSLRDWVQASLWSCATSASCNRVPVSRAVSSLVLVVTAAMAGVYLTLHCCVPLARTLRTC